MSKGESMYEEMKEHMSGKGKGKLMRGKIMKKLKKMKKKCKGKEA